MNDTPRTDKFMESLHRHPCDSWEIFAQKVDDFTRQLERELNAEKAKVKKFHETLNFILVNHNLDGEACFDTINTALEETK